MNASLFSKSSTGGAVARGGFRYQDDYVLLRLPQCLAQGAFDSVVSENLGDIEVRYFRPGGGTYCVAYEAKNHELSLKDFWREVETFEALHRGSPAEYVKFGLVCPSFHKDIRPLLNMLETLRGRGASLNGNSAYRTEAEVAVIDRVKLLGKSADLGAFVLRRVAFEEHADGAGQVAFNGLLGQHLPTLRDARGGQQDAIRRKCIELVQESAQWPVCRMDVERAICEALDADKGNWLNAPTRCYTGEGVELEVEEYRVPTADLNGAGRGTIAPARWQDAFDSAVQLVEHLRRTRSRSGVVLSAEHRMSTACMLGHAFAATRGIRLIGEHRGASYDFGDFTRSPGSFFEVSQQAGTRSGEGIVTVAFSPGLAEDVGHAADAHGLAGLPTLELRARAALTSNADVTAAVEDAKAAIAQFKAQNRLPRIHLFVKGPSFFAMGLGHRLNALGRVQLYDWVERCFVRTVLLA
jgi:hypothetical protein